MQLASALQAAAPAVGSAPPGVSFLTTIIGWVTFLVGLLLMGGFVAGVGMTGVKALRHGQMEGGTGPLICLVAGVFLTAASAIFGVIGITT